MTDYVYVTDIHDSNTDEVLLTMSTDLYSPSRVRQVCDGLASIDIACYPSTTVRQRVDVTAVYTVNPNV